MALAGPTPILGQPTSIPVTPGKRVVQATTKYPAKAGKPKVEMKIIIECDDPEDAGLYLAALKNASPVVETEVTSGMEELNDPSV